MPVCDGPEARPPLTHEPVSFSRVNLTQLFDLSLVGRANETALEWSGSEYTFGDLERGSNRVANALLASGLVKGDRLCVQRANGIEMIELFLACVKTGIIFVPVNVLYREREVAHITGDAEPRVFFGAESEFPRG